MPWTERPSIVAELPSVERLLLSADDDRFPDAVIEMGIPPVVQLATGHGHPLFWVATSTVLGLDGEALAAELAEGRPVIGCNLDWKFLLSNPIG